MPVRRRSNVAPEAQGMTFNHFEAAVKRAQRRHPEWRIGQTAFNVLWRQRRDIAEGVWSTPLDPFYDDRKLAGYMAYAEAHWSTPLQGEQTTTATS
jgi:hypothetical protein